MSKKKISVKTKTGKSVKLKSHGFTKKSKNEYKKLLRELGFKN